MKSLKDWAINGTTISALIFAVMAFVNSVNINSSDFMADGSGIKFIKRLDEMSGKIIIGRFAASTSNWKALVPKKKVKIARKAAKKITGKAVTEVSVTPAPAIKEDLNLSLTQVFYKKLLKKNSYKGHARTVDGVIEEVTITMPNGDSIFINTREKMVGNIFQYEDSYTRETKSGMFYEVKKGTYMITLTNDSQYAGARFEFKADNEAEIAYNDSYNEANISWNSNEQNQNDQRVENSESSLQAQNSKQEDTAKNAYNFTF